VTTSETSGDPAADPRSADQRLGRLQRSSQALSEATTEAEVIEIALELGIGPAASRIRIFWLHDEERGRLRLAGQRGLGPAAAQRYAEVDLRSEIPAALAVHERRSIVAATAAEAARSMGPAAGLPDPTGGFVTVPVLADDAVMGVLAFGGEGVIDDADVVATEAAAGLIGQTLSRLRLTEALVRRAEEAAAARDGERRRRQYFEFLVSVTQAAASSATSTELMEAVADAAVPTLGEWCRIHFAPEPDVVTTVDAHADPSAAVWASALVEAFPFDPGNARGLARVMVTGESERIVALTPAQVDDLVARGVVDPGLRPAVERIAGVMTVPLMVEGRAIGALQVVVARPRPGQDAEDVALVETVADRISPALQNLWRADQDRRIALALQTAFLPPRLPAVDRLALAARYLPASVAADVGGDFYDVFRIDGSTWALVMGDVCGTGADAAATAMIARHTARAAARHGHDPVTVVEWVNDAVRHSDRDLFCTMLYATLTDERAGEGMVVTVTSGGHPLPVVVDAGGARFVGAPGSLLGAFESIKLQPETFTVHPGDWLVTYTDGVTDLPAPHGLSDDGLLELVDRLTGAAPTVDAVPTGIERDLDARAPAPGRRDDVALLVARVRRPS
jgi:serine phosphatase RsbU (regulator of sigma subunit)